MIRFLLLAVVMYLLARAFWQVVDGIIAGLGGGGGQRQGTSAVKLVRDPICGTYVTPRTSLSLTQRGTTYYFCSEQCRSKFQGRT